MYIRTYTSVTFITTIPRLQFSHVFEDETSHVAHCILGNSIPRSVLRCIHQISANVAGNPGIPCIQKICILCAACILQYSRSCMIVCHSEHSFCTDFSVLELYLADSGKYSRSSGYFMHTEHLHTMRSIHIACCRNSKSSMIVWHFEHSLCVFESERK